MNTSFLFCTFLMLLNAIIFLGDLILLLLLQSFSAILSYYFYFVGVTSQQGVLCPTSLYTMIAISSFFCLVFCMLETIYHRFMKEEWHWCMFSDYGPPFQGRSAWFLLYFLFFLKQQVICPLNISIA